ncbi:dCTP deaminase [Paenibacillus sp. FSL R5-0766]|uniref:dCTP deaminase n=1 Tax=unclassified Paenibacillus TaxID=185978 RepID=UPI00096E81BC|nr:MULTISPECIES: dCTP deaminase [unclassified Paenibacillus]MBD8839088.1 dCTP deaminase [Paenibacillus sp. CFBP 13594]OMF59908.1 dCTP deaminase [Paenibacillus sp. FSL R5-0765]
MILTGCEIEKEVINENIHITPFNKRQINPNSYDFSLGSSLKVYKNDILDPKVKQETEDIEIPKEGLVLQSNRIYLGFTNEIMGSNKYVPIIRAKSSIARLGLFVHITADLIDIGSINQWTLQLHAVQSVKVFPNMLIGQVTFWVPKGEIVLYDGKYQGSKGAKASQIYKDFV